MTICEASSQPCARPSPSRGTARMVLRRRSSWSAGRRWPSIVVLFGDLPVAALPPARRPGRRASRPSGTARRCRTNRPVPPGLLRRRARGARRGRPRRWRPPPGCRGSGVDPLFTVVFAAATLVNLATASCPSRRRSRSAALRRLHAALPAAPRPGAQVASRSARADLDAFQAMRPRDRTVTSRRPAPARLRRNPRTPDNRRRQPVQAVEAIQRGRVLSPAMTRCRPRPGAARCRTPRVFSGRSFRRARCRERRAARCRACSRHAICSFTTSGGRAMSLVRLLGFQNLTCGCVIGRYRDLASGRELTYVEEKGSTCEIPRAPPQPHGGAER